ncbi:MAG: DUF3604 domain-containing protein [Sphingomonadales bacterium]|jgi:hypothetical protein|nr:DUF3604 domain-containing protein [Sphingomonadales bacterium]MBK9267239.1 DUF3604 domain-containing protein [Sphingomonadales bacterium]MBP6433567.1 DUF3604 domain-containing protein [Sphingorhabdus sp.]
MRLKATMISSLAMATLLAACSASMENSATTDTKAVAAAGAAKAEGKPDQLLWGDIHLHTEYSMDANTFGARLSPDDAYRFAKGEAVTASNGMTARLETPLDFLMVADHADYLGSFDELRAGNPLLTADPKLREWRSRLDLPRKDRLDLEPRQTEPDNPSVLDSAEIRAPYWKKTIEAAERANRPGKFTALMGFEWTAQRGGQNLHRVVMFRDGPDKVGKVMPLSSVVTDEPMDLYDYLASYERNFGGRVLAVAHNGNISNGIMFPLTEREFGEPMTAEYVKARARWEPAYEITQIKGDGETHPFLSSDDEFAAYETWDKIDFSGVPKTKDMFAGEYARSALKRGLMLEQRYGVNPYKFGFLGSTDAHTGLSAVDEDNFWGKHSAEMEPSPTRWKDAVGGRGEAIVPGWMMASAGYAAVWARNNTREEIFDAFMRKEIYATTGPRIRLRFFGGWDFAKGDADGRDIAAAGYGRGVPMGSDLKPANGGGAPTFLVHAMRDPNAASLDRVQIVKGWIDANGETHEKVFDVVWSHPDTRSIGKNGKLSPIRPGTVDVPNTTFDDSVGAAQLYTAWRDPQFNPRQKAFYYVRVLQVPTPRWTAYDAKKFGIVMPDYVPMVTQERAYSSPIWYTPG